MGSALAGLAIPIVGTVIVVFVRQLVTAAVTVPLARPRVRQLGLRALLPAIALGVVLAAMNLTFYESVHRLGLGMAASIEFLGPLALAIASSRRLIDVGFATAAGVGVFLLIGGGDGAPNGAPVDPLGVGFALTAAASWAAYIVLTRTVATRFAGLEGLAVASMVALALLAPFAVVALWSQDFSAFSFPVAGLLLAGGILSSAIPYSLDTFILRRISARIYSIITSTGPVMAAALGWLLLAETFTALQIGAIALVSLTAAATVATQGERPPRVPA